MAYELVEEVLNHAPAMTPAERLILVCIAEASRVRERARAIASAELHRRCCIDERGLRHALNRLAERRLEVRVELGRNKHGHPFYAVPGVTRTFWLPHLIPAGGDCVCYGCRKADSQVRHPVLDLSKADTQGRQADLQVRLGGHTGPSGGPTSPPLPSVDPYRAAAQDPRDACRDTVAASSRLTRRT